MNQVEDCQGTSRGHIQTLPHPSPIVSIFLLHSSSDLRQFKFKLLVTFLRGLRNFFSLTKMSFDC